MSRTFYIIDGHAQIFRAYFAPFRELSSPTGEPTKATYVFTQMLMALVEKRSPDYLAMVIDSGKQDVFRTQIYPQYKANRPPAPPDFHPQEQRILQLVRDAGVPLFVKPGFEADDLLATMATRLAEHDFDVVLVSKDKDLRQLLTDRVRMYDVQSDVFVTPQSVERDHGYTPAQAVEVQTLMGDSTDNVPGVPGVGDKTAAKLIAKYGSVQGVLDHVEELTPKLKENLKKSADLLPVSRELVTLRRDVEFDFDPEQCVFKGFNAQGLRKHLAELGFTTLLKRVGGDDPAPAPAPPASRRASARRGAGEIGLFGAMGDDDGPDGAAAAPPAELETSTSCDYRLIDTLDKLQAFVAELRQQKRFAFDTETDDLGAMRSRMIGMSFSWKPGTGCYVAVRGPLGAPVVPEQQAIELLRPVLEDPSIGKIGHNIKYDRLVMRQAGIDLQGIVMDTMVAAFLIDASRTQYGIDYLARELLRFRKIATTELIGKGRHQVSLAKVPLDQVSRYASEDVDICWRLAELLGARLAELPQVRRLNDELEVPLIDVLAEMEFNGVAVDTRVLREQSQVLSERAAALREQVMQAAGCEFNPDSPKQLAEVLFERLGLKPVRRNKTGPSTDAEVLEKLSLEHKVPRLILEYRSLVKLINTYLDNLGDYVNPATGRIHGSFNQTGAATGRLSMSDPNLQNIPIRTDEGARIRLAFVPGDAAANVLLTADYSQIELRVLAHFTQEPALLKAFEADEDIHRAVASEVFAVPLDEVTREQRSQAKVVNFGIIYGISAFGLAQRIEGLTVPAARELIDAYNKRFPSIARFMDQCVMEANSQGYVETILGRRRPIPELRSPVLAQRNAGERMAINSVVQGSAADLIKRAMLHIHRRIRSDQSPSRLLLQVHDELVFETPRSVVQQEADWIRHEMVNAMQLRVPLKVDVGWGGNWQEGKK